MSKPDAPPTFKYDAFISYSRRDSDFARRLEQALSGYKPPKDLAVPQRRLRVFRDESDFQGAEYHASLDRNLRESANLVVLCSPNSAHSAYVEDEIRRFAQYRDKDHIIPLMIAGMPNNEVKNGGNDELRAFPDELVKLLPIPLANDYRGFDARTDKLNKGRWISAWFKTLADLYADYGVDRSQIEQREQKRKTRNLRIIAAATSVAFVILAGLTIWALISRAEARRQRDLALARQYETEARLAFDNSAQGLVKASLLSVASLESSFTLEGYSSLDRVLQLLPPLPAWKNVLTGEKEPSLLSLAFSPDGSVLATASANGAVRLWEAKTGHAIARIEETRGRNVNHTSLAFSPDGKFLVSGCERQACVIDLSTRKVQTRLPQAPDAPNHGGMVWSLSFSSDGGRLAAASYASNEVLLYDTETWRVVGRIAHPGYTVRAVAFSPDGNLASLTDTGQLRLWAAKNYQSPTAELQVSGTNIAFAKSDCLITSSGDLVNIASDSSGALKLQRMAEGRLSTEQARAVYIGEDSCIVAGGLNTSVRLLCGERFQERLRFLERTAAFALSPDGRWLAIQSKQALAMWPLVGGSTVARIELRRPVKAIAVGAEQNWFAAGSDDGSLAFFDATTWREKRRLQLGTAVVGMEASAGAHWLIVSAATGIHVIDASLGREIFRKNYDKEVSWAATEPGNRWLIVLGEHGLSVLDARDWHEQIRAEHGGPVNSVQVSADGKYLATVTAPQWSRGLGLIRPTQVRVWDVAEDKEIAWAYDEQGDLARNKHWTLPNDDKFLKRPREWGQTKLIAQATGWRPLFVANSSGEMRSSDQRWIVNSSRFSSTITLIDVRTERPVGGFPHNGGVYAAAFLPPAAPRWLASGSADGMVRIWPLESKDMIVEACARLRQNIDPETLAAERAELVKTLSIQTPPCA